MTNNGFAISTGRAVALREHSKAGMLDLGTIANILSGQSAAIESKPYKVKINSEVYGKFFKPEQSAMYFGGNRGGVK